VGYGLTNGLCGDTSIMQRYIIIALTTTSGWLLSTSTGGGTSVTDRNRAGSFFVPFAGVVCRRSVAGTSKLVATNSLTVRMIPWVRLRDVRARGLVVVVASAFTGLQMEKTTVGALCVVPFGFASPVLAGTRVA